MRSVNGWQDIAKQIEHNFQKTLSLQKEEDGKYEEEREKVLIRLFEKQYEKWSQPNALCMMGAWHVQEDVVENRFGKKIREKIPTMLNLEMQYENTQRTVKTKNGYQTIVVNDKMEEKKYKKMGKIWLSREDSYSGIIPIRNGSALPMMIEK